MVNLKPGLIGLDIINNPKSAINYPKFINNRFVLCEELFPYWKDARKVLTYMFGEPNTINVVINDNSTVTFSVNVKFDSYGKNQSKYKDVIVDILKSTLHDYIPQDCNRYRYEPVTNLLVSQIQNDVNKRERWIIRCGGRCFHDELLFRFGLKF